MVREHVEIDLEMRSQFDEYDISITFSVSRAQVY